MTGRRREPTPDSRGGGKLDLLLGDFARVLGAKVALLCELDRDGEGHVVCSSGILGAVAIAVPRRRSRRFAGVRAQDGGCFVGRALTHERPAFDTLHPDRDAELIRASEARLACALAVPVQIFGRRSGRVLVAVFSAPPADPEHAFWIADFYARLTALLDHQADALGGLLERSQLDDLTGCVSYKSMLDQLDREINRSSRADLPLSCCFIDLDGFKRVNDQHGHLLGNEVLSRVGRALIEGVRSCDTVGRYGGDEFIAVLPQTTADEAAVLAERLRSLIATSGPKRFGGPLTASIGVAEWAPGISSHQLLTRADRALFAAKESVGGGVATYDPRAVARASDRILAG
jgi:diguanylate cyclase (GGDEF)-like protein